MTSRLNWVRRNLTTGALAAAEGGLVPDPLLRWGIRRLCAERAAREAVNATTAEQFARRMTESPVATHTDLANQQHYEAPTELFEKILGPYLKYSACIFSDESTDLADAEAKTLALTCERAQLEDGMRVLDLGCGWGSLTRFIAEHYPSCQITAISNSKTQGESIQQRCDREGYQQVDVITADVASFDLGEQQFDRVFSIEMFEHMRNWSILFNRIARALTPEGRFFMHVFCHDAHPYFFEDEGEPDWMARNFFSGGIMPCLNLPVAIQSNLRVDQQWSINGNHYARTLRAWLDRLDSIRPEVVSVFSKDLGRQEGQKAVQRWRMFLMACEELFAFNEGTDWYVAHYSLQPSLGPIPTSEITL